jgi:hypothetical protein
LRNGFHANASLLQIAIGSGFRLWRTSTNANTNADPNANTDPNALDNLPL